MARPSPIDRFWKFHEENPHVYRECEKLSIMAFERGRGRFGMKAIFERLRWWATFETNSLTEAYKLPNEFHAFYARLVVRRNPFLRSFFRFHKSMADADPRLSLELSL